MTRKVLLGLVILAVSVLARKVWEPEDVMPLFSGRDIENICMTETHFWISGDRYIVQFPCWDSEVGFSQWTSFPFSEKIITMKCNQESLYVWTKSGCYGRSDIDFMDTPFQRVESPPRFAPDIGGCPPRDENFLMPPGFLYETGGIIHDLNLQEFHVTDCASRNSQKLYMSTDGLGLLEIDRRTSVAEQITFGPCCNESNSMIVLEDTLIFAGCSYLKNCALTIYDRENSTFEWITGADNYAFPFEGQINCLAYHGGEIFTGTPYGLSVYALKGESWLRPTSTNSPYIGNIRRMVIQRDTLYIAASEGIFSYDIATRTVRKISPNEIIRFNDIASIGGSIYAAGDFGVWKIENGEFYRYNTPEGTLVNMVNSVTKGPRNETIFGGRNGILIVDSAGRRQFLSNTLYLEGKVPNDIVAVSYYLWIATNQGLFLYNRKYRTSQRMAEERGFPLYAINRLFLDGEYLWILTDYGAYRFFWNEPDRQGF